ncbi:MAG: transcription antitermination factor NusB [Nocardioides sp.]|uniref:RsmB/NOP family class I SAM-dependent RNA methyltransferase n=1 Tax=Nocardioides sp. TaxID=35761 RepID=UPI0039E69A0D
MADRRRRARPATTRQQRRRPDPARLAAFEVARAVTAEDAYTNLVLPHALRRRGLTGRDAAFATELVAGSQRGRGTYDAILANCLDRPLAKVDPPVLDVLRLGTHQLLGMRVPAHAALSSSVDLARTEVGASTSGFVNAVLRRVSQHDLAEWVRRIAPDPDTDPHGFAAIEQSHPRWIVDELAAALAATGAEDELTALLAADNQPPRVVLVARPGLADVAELPGERTPWSPYAVRLDGGDPADVPAVSEGRAGVQDEGSQLVAIALADAALAGRDERWLDLCAGPGGKAALLAALAADRGSALLASERQPHRAALVKDALRSAPGAAAVLVADGRRPPWRPGWFDRILVDAPCTGLGALRRRPEARWRRSPADLASLVPLQCDLLDSALASIRPGGVVCYATCSPALAETREVVVAALESHPETDLEDASALLRHVPDSAGPLPGTVQLWPHRHGTDAMFVALLRRRG